MFPPLSVTRDLVRLLPDAASTESVDVCEYECGSLDRPARAPRRTRLVNDFEGKQPSDFNDGSADRGDGTGRRLGFEQAGQEEESAPVVVGTSQSAPLAYPIARDGSLSRCVLDMLIVDVPGRSFYHFSVPNVQGWSLSPLAICRNRQSPNPRLLALKVELTICLVESQTQDQM